MKKPSHAYWITGNSPVSRPSIENDHPVAALMHAIPFALSSPEGLDFFLRAIFPPYPKGSPGGGDPGWLWHAELGADGKYKIVVEISDDIAPPNGIYGEYSEDLIRYEIRAALNNLCVKHPERKAEIEKTLNQFNLMDVGTPGGLEPIPSWDIGESVFYILNDL
jgi:hypothetical protein